MLPQEILNKVATTLAEILNQSGPTRATPQQVEEFVAKAAEHFSVTIANGRTTITMDRLTLCRIPPFYALAVGAMDAKVFRLRLEAALEGEVELRLH